MSDVVYRTTGPWGIGLTEDLTEVQVDTNFWTLVQAINAKAVQGVGISNFVANGGEFTVVLTDHTLLGPYLLPLAQIRFAPEGWVPEVQMLANTIFTHAGSTYITLRNHTTAMTFDPGANDGNGNDFYGLLLEAPALTIPSGGAVGSFLRKATIEDYVTYWGTAVLDDLDDVVLGTPVEGDALQYVGGQWTNAPISTTLAGLADVLASPAPNADDLVIYNGSFFTYTPKSGIGGVSTLSDVGDIAIAGIASPIANSPLSGDDVLTWNETASKWVNWPKSPMSNWASGDRSVDINDAGAFISAANASPETLTIPHSSTTALPFNFQFLIRQSTATSQVTVAPAASVTLDIPAGRLAKTRTIGSVIGVRKRSSNTWQVYGDLAYASNSQSLSFAIDPSTSDSEVFTCTPAGSGSITATTAPIDARAVFVFTTSGTTPYTITFGTGFKSQGTLSTGSVSGKVFTVVFVGDGTNMNEVSRTTAM